MARTKTKGGIAAVVLVSILCCILTFVLTLILVLSLTAHRAVQQETLVTAIGNLDLAELELPDGSLAAFIIDEFIDPEEDVEVRDIEKVLGDKEITKFASSTVKEYNDYLCNGGKFPQLRTDDILGLIERMEEDIYEETGLRFGNGDVEQLEDDLAEVLDDVNNGLEGVMGTGITGFGVRAVCSLWFPIVCGVLLMLILLWMLLLYVFKGFRAGTALKTFSITAFIACLLLLIGGLLTGAALGWAELEFISFLATPVSTLLLFHAGIGAGVCVVLFLIGLLLSRFLPAGTVPVSEVPYDRMDCGQPGSAAVQEPQYTGAPVAQESVPAPEVPVHEPPKRKFCRNCGKELVNPNAKFCYHCGNVQEHVE